MDETNTYKILDKVRYDTTIDPDGISKEWLLTESPFIIICLTVLYLLFILKLGPAYMKDKEPYRLKNTMRIYNLIQVLSNGYVIFKVIKDNHFGCTFNTFCQLEEEVKKCQRSLVPFLYAYWFYLALKLLDYLDTIFMVLRKKTSQVTFLHVYHHVTTVVSVWYYFYYYKTPQSASIAIINVFVHTVMYGYYFLATFSALKKYLWWKRHLTKLQLSQFGIMLAYLIYLYCKQCEIAPAFTFLAIFQVTIVSGLFVNFYIQTYFVKANKLK